METFIVRVYRGTPACAQELAGTVERVGTADRVGFSDREQLFDLLMSPAGAGDFATPTHEERK